jgi:3-oxoacyl-[acyl-carrier-protein] synthase-3
MSRATVIAALAHVLPENRVLSSDLEKRLAETYRRLNFPQGLLYSLTGIKERRFWDRGVTPSDAAIRAARLVLEQSGVDPARIGVLISTSVSKDFVEPSVASLVHGGLGLNEKCINFDIANACLGFLDGMNTASLMIDALKVDYALVVAGESAREPVENTLNILDSPEVDAKAFHANFATLTIGSGAAAMLLCRDDLAPEGHRIFGSVTRAATAHCRLCLGQRDQMIADAPAVMKHGVALALKTWQAAEESLPRWSDSTIDIYIPHQVSARNMRLLCQTLGLTPQKAHLNFPFLGNIGPAAVPITLSMASCEGRLKKGHHAALLGIGSGLNCTMMSVLW